MCTGAKFEPKSFRLNKKLGTHTAKFLEFVCTNGGLCDTFQVAQVGVGIQVAVLDWGGGGLCHTPQDWEVARSWRLLVVLLVLSLEDLPRDDVPVGIDTTCLPLLRPRYQQLGPQRDER